jgi:uncharacterized damage-inducible protein DinB
MNDGIDRLLTRLKGLPADALYREPRAGEWPVMSTMAHVVEMLPYWAGQATLIATKPGTPFGRTHDDPGRLGAIAAHASDPVEVVRTSLQSSREASLRALKALPEAAWDVTGEHPTRGKMSVSQVVEAFMVRHVEEHCEQVEATLASLGYSPSQVP